MSFAFTIERVIDADAETVFDVLTDHRGLADITPLRRSTLVREGDPAPNGVGAVRHLVLAGPPIAEEVTTYEPPSRFGYAIRSGLPLRAHSADVRIEPEGGRTRVSYRIEGTPVLPFTDKPLELLLRGAVLAILTGTTRRAEGRRRAAQLSKR